MNFFRGNTEKGFTFIELLLVVSIISLLSSFIFAAAGVSRTKAADAMAVANTRGLKAAFNLAGAAGVSIAMTNAGIDPGQVVYSDELAFRTMIDSLRAQGFLQGDMSFNSQYPMAFVYYGGSIGYMFASFLPTMTPSTSGPPGSCRPFDVECNPKDGCQVLIDPQGESCVGQLGCENPIFGEEQFDQCLQIPESCPTPPEQFCRNDIPNQYYCECITGI